MHHSLGNPFWHSNARKYLIAGAVILGLLFAIVSYTFYQAGHGSIDSFRFDQTLKSTPTVQTLQLNSTELTH